MPTRLVVADDSELIRRTIRTFIQTEPLISVEAEAADFEQTIQLAANIRPDVVLLDVRMPNPTNLTVAQIRDACGGCQVLAMSVFTDDETQATALELGAVRMLDKANLYYELIPAILELTQTPN